VRVGVPGRVLAMATALPLAVPAVVLWLPSPMPRIPQPDGTVISAVATKVNRSLLSTLIPVVIPAPRIPG
jgi:hypothetical protein